MTDAQHSILEEYIRSQAASLGLNDWSFLLSTEPPGDTNDSTMADVTVINGYKRFKVCVTDSFFEIAPELQRHVIIHELIHVHFFGEYVPLEALREAGQISEAAYRITRKSMSVAQESAVDGLAYAIAGKFPLIDWGEQ